MSLTLSTPRQPKWSFLSLWSSRKAYPLPFDDLAYLIHYCAMALSCGAPIAVACIRIHFAASSFTNFLTTSTLRALEFAHSTACKSSAKRSLCTYCHLR